MLKKILVNHDNLVQGKVLLKGGKYKSAITLPININKNTNQRLRFSNQWDLYIDVSFRPAGNYYLLGEDDDDGAPEKKDFDRI